jgi:serine protease Do
MDFFEKEQEIEKTDEINTVPPAVDESGADFVMPEGAVTNEEIVGSDFWEGITLPEMNAGKAEKKKRHIIPKLICCVICVAVGFGAAAVGARGQGWLSNLVTGGKNMTFTLPLADVPQWENAEKDSDGRYTAEGLAEACGDSVVCIEVYTGDTVGSSVGQGSGIVMSSNGYIVTNAHVVSSDAKGIKVVLNDGSEYSATLVGSDSSSDIAVLKIPAVNLIPAAFADSTQVKLGEEVVAIGSPAGYKNSITKGVVSGLDRTIILQSASTAVDCIQIDAAINPGNSGGALFNMWGQVIGITSSKLASTDYDGIGFAISTEQAKPVIEQLMAYGEIADKVRIGITFYTITEATAEIYGVKPGLSVAGIDESCDVADTALQVGDIITAIDGKDVTNYEDVSELLDGKKAGDEITCHVYRSANEYEDETEFDISFKLMEEGF